MQVIEPDSDAEMVCRSRGITPPLIRISAPLRYLQPQCLDALTGTADTLNETTIPCLQKKAKARALFSSAFAAA